MAEKTKTVALEADALIHGQRQKDYGPPQVNFERIAGAWNAYLHGRPGVDERALDAHDVANLMILLKAVRNAEGYKRDSTVDIVGYAALDSVVSGDDDL